MAKIRKREWVTDKGERRVAWSVNYYEPGGKRGRRQFTSRREAEDFRVSIEGDLRKGTHRPEAAKTLVRELASLYLGHIEGRMQRNERMTKRCFSVYEGHLRNYICTVRSEPSRPGSRLVVRFEDGIGHLRLEELTARRIGDFRDRLRNAGLSVITTRKILGTLRAMAAYAVSQDLLAINPVIGVRVLGRRGEGAKRIVPPSKDAIRQLAAVADEDFRVQFLFAAATGLRAGELHALRWEHIDMAGREVRVERRVDAYGEEDTTKTLAGVRSIPLSTAIIGHLSAWRARSPFAEEADLVFPNRKGGYLSHDNMIKRDFNPLFVKLAKAHDENPTVHPRAPARFNWHALRHFAISCWIEAGLSPKTVQTFAGHSSLQVTMDRYGHLFKSDDQWNAMNKIAVDLFKLG